MNFTTKLVFTLSILFQTALLSAQELNIKDLLHFKEVVDTDTIIFVHSKTQDTLITKINKWITPPTTTTLNSTDLIVVFNKKIEMDDATYSLRVFPIRDNPSELSIKVLSIRKHKKEASTIEYETYLNHKTVSHPIRFIRSGKDRFLEVCKLSINTNGDTELSCKRAKIYDNQDCATGFKPIFIQTVKALYSTKGQNTSNTNWPTLAKYLNSVPGSEEIADICYQSSPEFQNSFANQLAKLSKTNAQPFTVSDNIELDLFYTTDTIRTKKAIRKLNRIKKKEESTVQLFPKWHQKRVSTLKSRFEQKYIISNRRDKLVIFRADTDTPLNNSFAEKIIKQNVKAPMKPKNLKYDFSLLIKGNVSEK